MRDMESLWASDCAVEGYERGQRVGDLRKYLTSVG